MKRLLTIVILATLMTGSLALAKTSADDPPLFSIGPSETPAEAVIVEGDVKGQNQDPNVASDEAAMPNSVEGDE